MSLVHVKLNGVEDGFHANNCDELMDRIARAFGTSRRQLIIRDKEGRAVHGATEPWPPTEKPWELVVEKDEDPFVNKNNTLEVVVEVNYKKQHFEVYSVSHLFKQIIANFETPSDLLEFYDFDGNPVSAAGLQWPLKAPLRLQVINKNMDDLLYNYKDTGIVGVDMFVQDLQRDDNLREKLKPYMNDRALASNFLAEYHNGQFYLADQYEIYRASSATVEVLLNIQQITRETCVIIPACWLTV